VSNPDDPAANAAEQAKTDANAAEVEAERKKLDDERAAFAEERRSHAVGARLDELISAGKVLPAERDGLVAFMSKLDDAGEAVEFGEGKDAVKKSPFDFMASFLEQRPPRVDFAEHSRPDGEEAVDGANASAIAEAAVAYQEEMKGKGVEISIDHAVRHVTKEN